MAVSRWDTLGRGLLLAAPVLGPAPLAVVLLGWSVQARLYPGRPPGRFRDGPGMNAPGGPGVGADITVDVFDPTPPYEQIRRQIVAFVSSGVLHPGDRLPTVRQLANDLGLAAGTVARAYREQEAAGWLHTRRCAGTRVGSTPPFPGADPAALRQLVDEFVRRAGFLGADDSTIVSRVTDALS